MGHSRNQRNNPKVAKAPKLSVRPGDPEVRVDPRYIGDNGRKVSWQLGAVDWAGPWGRKSFDDQDVVSFISEHIRSFESMTWNELPQKQHHSIEVSKLNTCARQRLEKINQNDVDEIFSLRLQGQFRIYGIREGSILKVLWFDRSHGDSDTCVCRSRKKHT